MIHLKKGAEILGKVLLTALLVLIGIVLLMILVLIGYLLVQGGEGLGFEDMLRSPFMQTAEHLIQAIAIVGASFAMYALFERGRGWSLGWKQPGAGRLFGEGLLWGIGLMGVSFALIGLFGGFRITGFGLDEGSVGGLLQWFIIFTFVAVNEEVLSRGYLQGLIRYHYGSVAAVLVTSALFACMHLANDNVLQNPIPLLNLFMAGILLGVSREVSGGLWMPIGIHLTWNFFQGKVFGFAVSGKEVPSLIQIEPVGNEWISGGGFGAEGSVIDVLLIGVASIVLYRWYVGKKGLKGARSGYTNES